MWSPDETPFHGKHYRLDRPLNVPAPLTRPHPPIMIGGGGERKTLRLVANGAEVARLLDQLAQFAELGFTTATGDVADTWRITPLEIMGDRVIPEAAKL